MISIRHYPSNSKLCRGYEFDDIRKSMEVRDLAPVMPMRKTRKLRIAVDRRLYRLRNLAARCFNKLENARRFAARYDKTAESFLGVASREIVDAFPGKLGSVTLPVL